MPAVAELQAEIVQLETRLEQTEQRARRAYAEAENAQAELRFARERGDAPQTSVDNGRLRAELATALERAQAAEEGIKALRAEIILVKKGVDTDAPLDTEDGFDERTSRAERARRPRGGRGQPSDTTDPGRGQQALDRATTTPISGAEPSDGTLAPCAEPS